MGVEQLVFQPTIDTQSAISLEAGLTLGTGIDARPAR
jgi:hypothetical protein